MNQIPVCAYVRFNECPEGHVESVEDYICCHPEYKLVGIYMDEGRNHDQFDKMMKDCEEGQIKIVLTRSISRFAWYISDVYEAIMKLKDMGVAVYFEKENINTLDERSEVLLTIMKVLAEEEKEQIERNRRLCLQFM